MVFGICVICCYFKVWILFYRCLIAVMWYKELQPFWVNYCVIVLLQTWPTDQGGAGHPYLTDPECPRRPELTSGRLCLKKCRTDLDCKGKNKRCLCDFVCGRSCVKPNKRCTELQPIHHGRFEVTPYNKFKAEVRYICDDGYILSGDVTRVCQGDGTWSGLKPSCETEGNCKNPLQVPHATHDGVNGQTVFPLGAQITYKCDAGYKIDGFMRAMCVAEGRWIGPRMTCAPRRCGHPEELLNGIREGDEFAYPHKVTYRCSEGYLLIGRTWRHCQSNGEWSGTPPICTPVQCPKLTGPPNGHRVGTGYTYGSVIEFSCLRGFKLSGSAHRKCLHNGTWSGSDTTCSVVDCENPGPFYNGYIEYTSSTSHTTYGATVIFKCFGGSTFEGESAYSKCESNGNWSNPVPTCWNKCRVPFIENGTAVGKGLDEPIMHNTFVMYQCDEGFEPINKSAPSCFNGTLSYKPVCQPRSCYTRPGGIRDGMVRYYSVRHGDKALYRCNTGYEMKGVNYVECSYGQWVGQLPACLPVHCDHPGFIENGQILLVGKIGKYMYRQYVNNVRHNDQVEFDCNKGFKRVGPMGATCVDGYWSPSELPHCIPGQHPKLDYMYRGKRSIPEATE